ncbi:MAG TPA: glycosyltransferase family 87 protein [Methylovirgula sp.]
MAKNLARSRLWYVATGLLAFGVLYIALRPWNLRDSYMIGAPFGRDFINFWFGGHVVWTGNLNLLFDPQGYDSAISAMFGHHSDDAFVFSYPPHALLFLAPFGLLPYIPALLLWTACNLACLVIATRLFSRQSTLALAACLSPAALVMVLYGQFGGMIALAVTLALVHGKNRPWLGGLCLAFLSVKPQFALVLGLFLIAKDAWRTLLAGIFLTMAFVAASIAAFGLQPWASFIGWTIPFHARLLNEIAADGASSTVSLYTGLRLAGVGVAIAQVLQALLTLGILGTAMLLLRRAQSTPKILTIALFAMVIGLPYSNHYDLAIAAPVFVLALFDEDAPAAARLPLSNIAFLLWQVPILAMIALAWRSVPIANAAAVIGLVLLLTQNYRRSETDHDAAPA